MKVIKPSKGGESLLSRKLSEVQDIHGRAMIEECRIWLLNSLQSKHLCTRDIYSFISNQAKLKSQDDVLDESTSRSAMRSKILDLRKSLIKTYKMRRKRENELLDLLDNKCFSLRKHLRKIRSKVRVERERIMKSYRSKVEHYELKQKRSGKSLSGSTVVENNTKPTIPPRFLGEFSTLTIFGSPEDLPKPTEPKGPFICDNKIKLTKFQRRLLSREPKYSLVKEPSEMQFKTEIERMNTKHRWNEQAHEKKKQNSALEKIVSNEGRILGTYTEYTPLSTNTKYTPLGTRVKDDRLQRLFDKFEDAKERFTFNPLEKTLNFNKKRVTDYKLNKHVKLPKPLKTDSEFECEVRRRHYLSAFKKYRQGPTKKTTPDEGGEVGGEDSPSGGCGLHGPENGGGQGGQAPPPKGLDQPGLEEKKKIKRQAGREWDTGVINLEKKEAQALKELKKKVQNGEIVITQTDKSSRFAILSSEQYLKAGAVHTSKDQAVDWKHVKYLQGQVK